MILLKPREAVSMQKIKDYTKYRFYIRYYILQVFHDTLCNCNYCKYWGNASQGTVNEAPNYGTVKAIHWKVCTVLFKCYRSNLCEMNMWG